MNRFETISDGSISLSSEPSTTRSRFSAIWITAAAAVTNKDDDNNNNKKKKSELTAIKILLPHPAKDCIDWDWLSWPAQENLALGGGPQGESCGSTNARKGFWGFNL